MLLSSITVGQVTLSKEEVRNIANKIDSLQTLDSLNLSIISDYKNKVKTDSLVIVELESQIKIQEETIELVEDKVKIVKPTWYENKYLWGVFGAIPSYYIGYLIGKI